MSHVAKSSSGRKGGKARTVLERPVLARLADQRRGRDRPAALAWPDRDRHHRGAGARMGRVRHLPGTAQRQRRL